MPTELITVGRYSTSYEAHLVKAGLASFGISAFLADEHIVNANWMWSNLIGGVKVQVLESDVASAYDVIQQEPGTEQDERDAWGAALATCPACGSGNTHYFLEKRASLLTWLVFSFPIVTPRSSRVCGNCGHKWKA
jgi:hypothetical protein